MNYLDKLKAMRTKRVMEPTKVEHEDLVDVIKHLTYMQSALNAQVLRYVIIDHPCEDVFNMTNFPTKHMVSSDNQPSAYIVIGTEKKMPDTKLLGMDIGVALEIIKEALFDKGLDCVSINSIDINKLKAYLNIDDFYPEDIVAIGKSNMKVNIEITNDKTGTAKNEKGEHVVYKLSKDALLKEAKNE
ncbi:MAG: hypothetical protein LBR40_05445 [Bacilli bacterium]|jgi:nitroreductase|nr:hypothetical protein [Bacilli bacterium]